MKKIFLFIFLALCAGAVNSQININTTTVTATQMAQAIIGAGCSVSNAILTSSPGSAGIFTNGNTTNLGLSSGAVLTSGNANNINNPGQNFSSACSGNPPMPTNLLSGINGNQATLDVCILEFDVTPYCKTFSIKFVFGSEEYPEWVGNYNDAFGIFVSGLNPAGGNYSNLNIAVIPNTIVPITVSTVNATSNASYYIDNQIGSSIVYDGFTVPIVASANVVPCSLYHVKIMIADGKDCNYDSGVFLMAEDMTCPPAALLISPDVDICIGESAVLTASGADYYIWSPSMGLDDTVGSTVIATPTVTTTYAVYGYIGCDTADGITDSVTITVLSYLVVSISASSSQIAISEQTTLTATGAMSYLWLPGGDTTASITVSPETTTTYTVIGTGAASCASSATITVEVIGPIFIPNAFTPNGDGNNDVFMPQTVLIQESLESYEFLIFDRWGNLVFKTNNIAVGWNGSQNGEVAQEDVYVWTINFKTRGDHAWSYIGHVSLIR